MSTNKFVQVFKLALERTEERKLEWVEGSDDGVYDATLANHTLRVSATRNGPVFGVIDSEGRTIGVVDVDLLYREPTISMDQATGLLERLYSLARRAALHIDETLDALISELEKDGSPAKKSR